MMQALKRVLAPLERKIILLLNRAIVKIVTADTSGDHQRFQITALAGETLNGVERLQEYGLETYPLKDAEALLASLGGDRSHPLILVTPDRRYRPVDLEEGDVAIYTAQDKTASHRIFLDKSTGEIKILGTDVTIEATGDVTVNGGQNVTIAGADEASITGATKVTVDSDTKVMLGIEGADKRIILDGDPVVGGAVFATQTKVYCQGT